MCFSKNVSEDYAKTWKLITSLSLLLEHDESNYSEFRDKSIRHIINWEGKVR